MTSDTPAFFIVMGVSGSGKTTIAKALAKRLGCACYDGDDFHPPENVAKMAGGQPLDDADRTPWLARLASLIQGHAQRQETAVLACSALKKRYRDELRINDQVRFVYLEGDFDLIWQRMAARADHYMKPDMLRSQFAALEPPGADEASSVSIDQAVDEIVASILTEQVKAR